MIAKDLFGREVEVGDLVVYGHSGRSAGTRVGRVYQVDAPRRVRVFLVEKSKGVWRKAHHSKPLGFVRIDDAGLDIPKLEDL